MKQIADIQKYDRLLVFGLTACLLCVDTAGGLSFHSLTSPLLTMLLMAWLTSPLSDKVRPTVQIFVGEIIIAVCVVDCYCQIYLQSPISPKILSTILQTNQSEAHEFLSVFINYEVLIHWRLVLLIVLAALFPLTYLYKRDFASYKRFVKVRLLLAIVLIVAVVYEMPNLLKYGRLMSSDNDQKTTEGYIFQHLHEQIPTPLHRLAYAFHVSRLSGVTLQKIKKATFEATIDDCENLSPHIVLIIGESYNKHHSTLYGYHLPTTPLQQQRRDEGRLFVFQDAVSPWNITSNVLLDLFST